MSTRLTGKVVANLIVGLVALALVAGLALAFSGGSSTVSFTNTAQEGSGGEGAPPDGAPPEGEGQEGRRGPCRGPGAGGVAAHAIHGELIVPERPEPGEEPPEPGTEPTEFETIVLDAGEVTAVSDDSLTLERPDGEKVTVKITDDTKQREDAAIEVGDKVRVIADSDGNARAIMSRPDRPAGAPEGEEQARPEGAANPGAEGDGRPCRPHRGGPGGPRGGGGGGGRPADGEGPENPPEDVSTPA